MRSFPLLLGLVLIAGAALVGCSGNDKDRAMASSGSMPSMPATSQGAAGAGMTSVEESVRVDPSSSGGSTLQASMPYTDGKGGAVPQNVNAAPFLAASEESQGTQKNAAFTGLVSRADGTMYGPNDQPAAGIGPGMEGAAQGRGATASSASKASGLGMSAPVKPSSNQVSGK